MQITSLLKICDLQSSSLFFSSKTFEINFSLLKDLRFTFVWTDDFVNICKQCFANISVFAIQKQSTHAIKTEVHTKSISEVNILLSLK